LSEPRLSIGRFTARYLVASDHPDPSALAGRLDRAAASIGPYLSACLASLPASSPDAIWLLRKVEVELGVDAAAEPDAIAAAWSAAMARAVAGRLDTDAQGVAFFADRTAYLAAFLRDLAAGEAWSLWYYRAFDGLRALPIAAALRTAILADAGMGRAALLRLPPADAASVLNALSPLEARRVLTELAEKGECGVPSAGAVTAAWQEGTGFALAPGRLALAFYLSMARQEPAAAGSAAGGLALALAVLRGHVMAGAKDALAAIQQADIAGLYRAAGHGDGERLAALLQLPAATRFVLTDVGEAAPNADEAMPRYTPHGGLFLLLPHLPLLQADAFADQPDGAPHAAQLLRLLILGACAGEDAIVAVFLDPLWRDLFGIPPRFLLAGLKAWSGTAPNDAMRALEMPPDTIRDVLDVPLVSAVGPLSPVLMAAAKRVLDAFSQRLPGFGGSSPVYIRRNFLSCTASARFMPDGVQATLSRPPLHLVLSLAGMTRIRFDAPWLVRPIDIGLEA
jgi:hypothetical protein